MSYQIEYLTDRAIVNCGETVEEFEFTNAFLEIVSIIDIEKIKHIIFDCSKTTHYTIPADYMSRVKILTRFSTTWNPEINIITIATNPEVRFLINAYINHNDDLIWKYHLFENSEQVARFLDNN